MALLKTFLILLALVPAGWLTYSLFYGDLGINPAETLQLETGIWALRLLIVTLAITPIRRVTGWNRIIQFRRMFGLLAFFYASLHLLTYAALDRSFDLSGVWEDVAKRPFITFGMLAFAAMVPLALTSTRGWIRRLGRRWQLLHRLVYVSGVAGAIHYLWKAKVIAGSPVYYAAIVGILLLFRIVWLIRIKAASRPQPAAG
jgi:sulfoxide reductase heme-binding subunit YedZ